MTFPFFSFNMCQVYRCWIVWGRKYTVVILSFLLWLADLSCAGVLLWIQVTVQGYSLLDVNRFKPFFLAYTAIAIALNLVTTCES